MTPTEQTRQFDLQAKKLLKNELANISSRLQKSYRCNPAGPGEQELNLEVRRLIHALISRIDSL